MILYTLKIDSRQPKRQFGKTTLVQVSDNNEIVKTINNAQMNNV